MSTSHTTGHGSDSTHHATHSHAGHDPAQEPARVVQVRSISTAIIGSFLILLLGSLYYARGFFLPLFLAALLTLSFRPTARHLHRLGVPPPVSAVLLVLSLAIVLGGAILLMADPVASLVSQAPTIIAKLKQRFDELRQPLQTLAEAGKQLQGFASATPSANTEQFVVSQPGTLLSWAADTLTGIGTTVSATLIFTVFLLSSGDLFLYKLVRVVGSLSEAKRSLRIVHDVENEVSRYLFTITIINLGLGILVGISVTILGLPGGIAWVAVVALLNYIPYVGAFTGIVCTAAVALITYPSLIQALLPPGAYLVLSFMEGTFVTPLVLGRRLELNSVAILIILALGGWMWGIVGAVIAVPILVVIKVFCDHFPHLSTFGAFLSSQSPQPNTSTTQMIEEEMERPASSSHAAAEAGGSVRPAA